MAQPTGQPMGRSPLSDRPVSGAAQQDRARLLALGGLVAAATAAATFIRVPAPTYNLYFNLGEAVLYTAALTLGGWIGAAGGLGAAVADLLLGYPIWAPITLVIKGLEGLVVGRMAGRHRAEGRTGGPAGARTEGRVVGPTGGQAPALWRDIVAVVPGALIMLTGYATAAGLLYGAGAVPIELGGDLVQVTAGAVVAIPLARVLRRVVPRSGGAGERGRQQ